MRTWAAASSSSAWCGRDGFAKNERDNIRDDELETLRDIAKGWLEADAAGIGRALAEGVIEEVIDDPGEEGA